MIKNIFVILLLCCFYSSVLCSQANSMEQQNKMIVNGKEFEWEKVADVNDQTVVDIKNKIAKYKYQISELHDTKEFLDAYIAGEVDFSEEVKEGFKERILFNIEELFQELNIPENEQHIQFIQGGIGDVLK